MPLCFYDVVVYLSLFIGMSLHVKLHGGFLVMIFTFGLHQLKLSFHLPGEQLIYFKGDDEVEIILNRDSAELSMLIAWMNLNKVSGIARKLTYAEIPNKFTYDSQDKQFNLRQRGFSIGRINYVPMKYEEGYYLRVLLNEQRGPRSFDEIKTVGGVVYGSFKDACGALRLLDDDKEYIEDLKRTCYWQGVSSVRQLEQRSSSWRCLSSGALVNRLDI